MTTENLIKTMKSFHRQMLKTIEAKNHDYSGAVENDAFANFKIVEALGATSVETGFITRISDKLARLSTLIKRPAKVLDESFEDTCVDAANYFLLLASYRKHLAGQPARDAAQMAEIICRNQLRLGMDEPIAQIKSVKPTKKAKTAKKPRR